MEEGLSEVVPRAKRSWSLQEQALLAVVAFVAIGSVATIALQKKESSSALLTANNVRACSFAECEKSGCASEQPYACVELVSSAGCSATPWPLLICKDSCSTADCSKTKPDKSLPTCANVKCPHTVCDDQQACGDEQPYKCLEGSARFGCSDDPYSWALALPALCGKCCDVSTC